MTINLGCYLQSGVDPTAAPILIPPAVLAGTASKVAVPSTAPLVPSKAIPPLTGVVGYLAVAVAYFGLGVAVGALARRLGRLRTPLLFLLVVPGVVAGLGFLIWVVSTLA